MDALREQLLAGTRFAADQHRAVGAGKHLCQLDAIADGTAVAEDIAETITCEKLAGAALVAQFAVGTLDVAGIEKGQHRAGLLSLLDNRHAVDHQRAPRQLLHLLQRRIAAGQHGIQRQFRRQLLDRLIQRPVGRYSQQPLHCRVQRLNPARHVHRHHAFGQAVQDIADAFALGFFDTRHPRQLPGSVESLAQGAFGINQHPGQPLLFGHEHHLRRADHYRNALCAQLQEQLARLVVVAVFQLQHVELEQGAQCVEFVADILPRDNRHLAAEPPRLGQCVHDVVTADLDLHQRRGQRLPQLRAGLAGRQQYIELASALQRLCVLQGLIQRLVQQADIEAGRVFRHQRTHQFGQPARRHHK